MAMFFFKPEDPTDSPPILPDGVYFGTIEKIEEKQGKDKDGNPTVRATITVKPHPSMGVKGQARITLPYPKDADDWVNNEWQKIYQTATNSAAAAIVKVNGKELSSAAIEKNLLGKAIYFSHVNDAREYEEKDKTTGLPTGKMRKASDTRVIMKKTYEEEKDGNTFESKGGGSTIQNGAGKAPGKPAAAPADDDLFAES